MEKIDYAYLRNVQTNEKMSMELTKLPENFYTESQAYITTLKENNEKNPSLVSIREYENTRKIFEEIVNTRIKKIVLDVLQLSTLPKNALPEEVKVYESIKNEILRFKNELFSHTKNTEETAKTEIIENEQKTEGFKKVKILKDIPQYRGSDGNMYGPYQAGTSTSIPADEADFLISNKMAEKME
ncbi:DNA replication complex GINS family protein [Candidatus Micrarchaeota archaeon]|nr:DNA replication complex GINS family protein [Candidatus Micrarchaeota archaeon]